MDEVIKAMKRKDQTTNAFIFGVDVMIQGETEAEGLWQDEFGRLGLSVEPRWLAW